MNYKIFAGGDFVESSSELSVVNPFDGNTFAKTWYADENILEKSIEQSLKIKDELKNLPAYQRGSALKHIANRLDENEEEFASIIAQEAAKPWKYAISEVRRAAQTFTAAAEEAKRLPREYLGLDWNSGGENKEALVKYFPAGLIAGISPFNFPLNLAAHKIAPAIAAGCPIILKPATTTPLSTLKLSQIISETSLPKGSVSVLPMNRETGNRLVTDERFKILTFTGSSDVGWNMKANSGKKKVTLELGGNAGTIVTQSADLDNAIKQSIVGGFAYQGQVCIHAQRFFVHESIFESFINDMIKCTNNLKYGDPLKPDTDITAMIDEKNAKRVESWVEEAKEMGGKVLTGGKRKGSFFEPTILTNTKPEMKVNCMEIFGPVITVESYTDFASAVSNVNDSEYGLQSSVFTNQLDEMDYAFENIETGGIIINSAPTFRVDHMPYGGIKDSGIGREGVKYAIYEMLEPRLLVKNFNQTLKR